MGKVTCPACGSPMKLKSTPKFKYRNGCDRLFYGCTRFPSCTATHGAHPDGRPLGKPALKDVKDLRIKVHAMFDELWKNGKVTRAEAYKIVSEKMGYDFHIANLDKENCIKVMEILQGKI